MKQLIQSYNTGELRLVDVPVAMAGPGHILVQTAFSAVSLGTEMKKVTTARQSLLGKARTRPDLVRQVVRSARREGLLDTYRKVADRLREPMSLGYSAAGIVLAVGTGVQEFRVGDRVACGGEGAAHAEVLCVPVKLCARVPDGVSLEHAAFTTIGAIALQGLRQAEVTLGETVGVIGLGLLGQLSVQLVRANGCRVVGIDLDPGKVALAGRLGIDYALVRHDPGLEAAISAFSGGYGMDVVVITASSSNNDPVELAAEICRDRGRIVVVGDVKIDIPRDVCYSKELEVRLSRSYGPGRYDPAYEQEGVDYPIGYVRWTEQRNMQAFLDLLATPKLNLGDLITHRFPFSQAEQAYGLLTAERRGGNPPLGVLFEYDIDLDHLSLSVQRTYTKAVGSEIRKPRSEICIGFIGAGSFARKFLIPSLLREPHVRLVGVATATGISGKSAANKFGFIYSTGDYRQILGDLDISAVFIATRHNMHAQLASEALASGKAVFVEKPLALTKEQLAGVVAAHAQAAIGHRQPPILMVGFNRRFAPMVEAAARFFKGRREPLAMAYRINAGRVPLDHWTQDPKQGGGRIIGEVCHFIDLVQFLAGAPAKSVFVQALPDLGKYRDDNVAMNLSFEDGSVANILYVANGDVSFRKERLEIFGEGKTAVIDDYRTLTLIQGGRKITSRRGARDKGHQAEIVAWLEALRAGGPEPVPFAESVSATHATFGALQSLAEGRVVSLS